ncbi:hypothetical protein Q4488_01130 [Amphritea sp. 1_MG-2023]|uniref:hypothetical protein n=1 Tax=Amphritea sp. 1_MG-2023 TaxID=3062670 RepID=UPI0026E3CCC3|nr:hypothetical protein [Amphritea sp. 1_MG-2023]MDO6561975.1 hypothetical protein [Amphritea sp. 1_MG-2023]
MSDDAWAFFTETVTAPTFITGIVCLLLVLAGLSVIKNMKRGSPLEPYILQILGLLFIVPVVALLAIVLELESEAITGILGTIVGYIFGTSSSQQKASIEQQSSPTVAEEVEGAADNTNIVQQQPIKPKPPKP